MAYTFTRMKPQYKIKKGAAEEATLRALRAFLDAKEPELVYFLTNTWRTQGRALTYKQLREAILAGVITDEILEEWMQDYTAFVTRHLQPAWIAAMDAAAEQIHRRHPEFYFDPHGDAVREWTTDRAAQFVTEVSYTQIEGIRAVVQRAAVLENMSVDELARAIRPMVGLTHPQAVANLRYYTNLVNNGVSEKKAQDLSLRYAARQHRYRGYNIARTELAFAYNQGAYLGTQQAQERGYMGETVKIWCTADDERVCPICGALEGKRVAMDEDFPGINPRISGETIHRVPPAHPSCRCAVIYKEIEPPIPTIETTQKIVNIKTP